VTEVPARPLTLPVDSEHAGLRVAVVVAFVLTWIIGYFVVSTVAAGSGLNLLALLGSFVLAYLASNGLERLLRQRWPSGRVVQMDTDGARTLVRGVEQQYIRADAPAAALFWSFQTRRRTRVPKGWHVVACALEQEERYLSVYTFMSPEKFKAFRHADRFTALKAEAPKTGSGRDDLLLAGEQRRLREAENHRWVDGAEMSAADFETFIDQVSAHFRAWIDAR
jgi:hypothetical protein